MSIVKKILSEAMYVGPNGAMFSDDDHASSKKTVNNLASYSDTEERSDVPVVDEKISVYYDMDSGKYLYSTDGGDSPVAYKNRDHAYIICRKIDKSLQPLVLVSPDNEYYIEIRNIE